jgi:hypothetical protein
MSAWVSQTISSSKRTCIRVRPPVLGLVDEEFGVGWLGGKFGHESPFLKPQIFHQKTTGGSFPWREEDK